MPPRPRRLANQPPSPESEPGLPVARPRCSSAPSVARHGAAPDPVGRLPDLRCRSHHDPFGRSPDLRCRSSGPRSAGCPAPSAPDAVRVDPVSRAIAMAPPERFRRSSWGASTSSSRCAGQLVVGPVARRLGTSQRVASRPVRNRFRLVDRARSPIRSTRRLPSSNSVARSRSACALRYDEHNREHETPGQEVFLNPQGYPLNFSFVPRILASVHRSCTVLSPDFEGRDRVDDAPTVDPRRDESGAHIDDVRARRLNGRRCATNSPSSPFARARATHVLVLPPTGRLFCCPPKDTP